MKVYVIVDIQKKIEADITIENIAEMVLASAGSGECAAKLLNNVACVLRAMTNEVIGKLNDSQRKVVADFLREQAEQYKATEAK